MRDRASILTLSLSLLLASPARAQDAGQRAQEAVDEIERLREAGKLRAAEERLRQTRSIPRQEIPAPVMSRLVLAQDALLVAVAAAYTRGEDCGYFSAEERANDPALADRTPAELGLELFATLLERLDRIKDPAVQTAYLTEPRFAPLRERPLARCIFASTWRRPHREVWPGVRVESGDHAFDVAFDLAAHLALQRPGGGDAPARAWLAAEERQQRPPGELWACTWRFALLSPQDKGGLPSRAPLLQKPELVASALEHLRARAGPAPWGFDALCLVNLTIAAGDHPGALALLERLRRQGGFLYDQALDKALAFVGALDRKDPAVQELNRLLFAHGVGAAPPAAPPSDAFGPLRAGIEELRRLTAAGKYPEMRARYRANQKLVGQQKLPGDVMTDMFASEAAAFSVAATAHARGEKVGWYTAAELKKPHLQGKSGRELGASILDDALLSFAQGVPIAELRHRVLTDPALRAIRDTPMVRAQSYSWGTPASEVWPGLQVVTGDAAFDQLFREVAALSPRPGVLIEPVRDFIKGPPARQRDLAEEWCFRWRCALLAPLGEGGWPTRFSLLQDPAAVAEALRALEARTGRDPAGFDALVRINLHIAAGDHDRARALLARLGKEGGILYDLGVTKALTMTYNVRGKDTPSPSLQALIDDLRERMCGFPPP